MLELPAGQISNCRIGVGDQFEFVSSRPGFPVAPNKIIPPLRFALYQGKSQRRDDFVTEPLIPPMLHYEELSVHRINAFANVPNGQEANISIDSCCF